MQKLGRSRAQNDVLGLQGKDSKDFGCTLLANSLSLGVLKISTLG